MSIIIDRVSCINEDSPAEGAELFQFTDPNHSLYLFKYWLLDSTVEEAVKNFGRCVVSWNAELELFRVVIYDDYIE